MRTYIVVLAAFLAVACKGKPKPQAAPGSGKVETQTSNKPHDIELPHADGTPPIKTTAGVKPETLKKMSEMTFPGFNVEVKSLTKDYMWVYQKTPDHPVLRASIHAWSCKHDGTDCWPLDVESAKKDHMPELSKYLGEELKKAKDTVFEVGKTDLYGAPAIYVYQLGQVIGEQHSEFTHAYVLYFNDGNNEIRVLAEYKDDMMKSKEDMAKALSREDLENTAKAFLDVYTHHWQE